MATELPVYITEPGDYNSMPGPYRELEFNEGTKLFWHYFDCYGAGHLPVLHRSVSPKNNPDTRDAEQKYDYSHTLKVMFYQSEAIGVLFRVVHATPEPWKFYKIGCTHQNLNKKVDTMRGDHQRECADCGLKWGWDSSD